MLLDGNIMPNIFPIKSFVTAGFFSFFMTLRPQNVKNILTFLPVAAAPLAITNEARALSKSSLNTISVLLSLAIADVVQEASSFAIFSTIAVITPPELFILTSFAPTIRHQPFKSSPKA